MKMRILLLAFICWPTFSIAQAADVTLATGAPAEVGMSADVLAAGVSLYREAIDRDELRGAVLLVARRGKVVLHEALGWRNKEDKLPMQKDTLFRMASNTKPVAAAATLMLHERGKLNINDNVRRHIPAWDNHRAAFIKIRHLMNHTSGLRIPGVFIEPLVKKSKKNRDAPSLRAEVDRFGDVGGEEFPGTTFRYNNPAFNTLGQLIETASGKPFREFVRQEIYQPLGMKDAWNYEADAPADRMARVYVRNKGVWKIKWKPGDGPDWPFVRSSGGMICAPWDYAVFCQMFLNNGVYGGKRILKEQTAREATSIQTRSAYSNEEFERNDRFYGYGWFVDKRGVYSHGGSDGTFAWIDPKNEIVGLVFTQSPGGRNPRNQFMKVVEAACYEGK